MADTETPGVITVHEPAWAEDGRRLCYTDRRASRRYWPDRGDLREERVLHFAIFEAVAPDLVAVDLGAALGSRVVFLALSLDAKLAAGHWKLIGHCPVRDGMPLPAYKEAVGIPGNVDVVDYSGQRRRPARGAEAELLPNRKVVAPVRLEMALRAKHGLEPWVEAYSDLAPDETTTAARLLP